MKKETLGCGIDQRNIFHQRIEKREKANATGYQKEIETRSL
jgi:hypothetical protein